MWRIGKYWEIRVLLNYSRKRLTAFQPVGEYEKQHVPCLFISAKWQGHNSVSCSNMEMHLEAWFHVFFSGGNECFQVLNTQQGGKGMTKKLDKKI